MQSNALDNLSRSRPVRAIADADTDPRSNACPVCRNLRRSFERTIQVSCNWHGLLTV